jgi:hypothetical protein
MLVRCNLTSVCGQIWSTMMTMWDARVGFGMVKFCVRAAFAGHCVGV